MNLETMAKNNPLYYPGLQKCSSLSNKCSLESQLSLTTRQIIVYYVYQLPGGVKKDRKYPIQVFKCH